MSKQIDRLLPRILPRVQKPARYVGGEYNQTVKDPAGIDTRVAFCFPDTYEIGMSNVGLRILYGIVNQMEGVWCERVFTPWGDMEDAMRAAGLPLYALESHDPVADFDMIAFSVGYEMSYTNILTMLDLAGIPLHAAERKSLHNIVFAGGACTYNPEPLADFIDFFSLGEGEESTVEIVNCYRDAKKRGLSKEEFLWDVGKIPGIYVPSHYKHQYKADGTLAAIVPLPGAPAKVTKRIVQDLEGVRIFATHGHTLMVKYGLLRATLAAEEEKANVLLFGHTHEALCDWHRGLWYVNPGTCSGSGPVTYAVMELDRGSVRPAIHEIVQDN